MKMLVGQRFLLQKEVPAAHDTCITLNKAGARFFSKRPLCKRGVGEKFQKGLILVN